MYIYILYLFTICIFYIYLLYLLTCILETGKDCFTGHQSTRPGKVSVGPVTADHQRIRPARRHHRRSQLRRQRSEYPHSATTFHQLCAMSCHVVPCGALSQATQYFSKTRSMVLPSTDLGTAHMNPWSLAAEHCRAAISVPKT